MVWRARHSASRRFRWQAGPRRQGEVADKFDLESDILTFRFLFGLSAVASDSPLLSLLASGSGVFFTRGVLCDWRLLE